MIATIGTVARAHVPAATNTAALLARHRRPAGRIEAARRLKGCVS